MSRTGPPWMFGSGWPFMPHTIRLCSSIAFFDPHAARQRAACVASPDEVRVGAVMPGVFRPRLHARSLQHVGQPHAGPFGAAGAAVGPLVAARLRREERAAVAAAFEHHAVVTGLKFLLQLAERESRACC